MLAVNFDKCTTKGSFSANPFVDHNAKSVLVAGRARLALQLLRSHVINGSGLILYIHGMGCMGDAGNAKVGQQDFVVLTQEHVIRFDVAVDDAFLMRILEGFGYLVHIANDDFKGKLCAFRVSLAQ